MSKQGLCRQKAGQTKALANKKAHKRASANKKTAIGGLHVVVHDGGLASGLVANHYATSFRGTLTMPSAAAAGTGGGHDYRAGNDNDRATVRLASAVGTAVKARTATAFNLDDHVGRSLGRGKRQSLRGTAR
jgi:hypothetical protein